jgi:LacI family transcriptional regulator
MGKKVTLQDIADAQGISRNTVSKVFNGRGAVPEETRRLVLDKARELGYSSDYEAVLSAAWSAGRSGPLPIGKTNIGRPA